MRPSASIRRIEASLLADTMEVDMNQTAEQVLTAALGLPDDDRLELIEALIHSFQPADRPPFDESWREVVRRRSAELSAGVVTSVPWSEVKRTGAGQGLHHRRGFLGCLVLCLAVLATDALDAAAQDHLLPELGSLNDPGVAHAKSIREVLLKDAAFYYRARVICLPSGTPAWVVTLTREQEDPPAYFVEYAVFEHGGGNGVRIEDSRVRKEKVPIDREAAEAIQGAWLKMLRAVRYPEVVVGGGADGITYHFSRFVPHLSGDSLASPGWETGQVWSPKPGSPPGRLASISELMRDYALASKEERAKLRGGILKEAVGLNSDLDKSRRPNESAPK
jgi:putative addiction module component (TIGR02574 family)